MTFECFTCLNLEREKRTIVEIDGNMFIQINTYLKNFHPSVYQAPGFSGRMPLPTDQTKKSRL
jgi:hypothetical protein